MTHVRRRVEPRGAVDPAVALQPDALIGALVDARDRLGELRAAADVVDLDHVTREVVPGEQESRAETILLRHQATSSHRLLTMSGRVMIMARCRTVSSVIQPALALTRTPAARMESTLRISPPSVK